MPIAARQRLINGFIPLPATAPAIIPTMLSIIIFSTIILFYKYPFSLFLPGNCIIFALSYNTIHGHISPLYIRTVGSIAIGFLLLSLTGCSPTKHVPQGEYLLDKVKIVTDNKEVKPETLKPYLRQEPNFRILGVARLQLAIYNLSGQDTSKWLNRWFRKIGTPPVIYDESATAASCQQLSKALSNAGYMHAEVEADTVIKKRRIQVTYRITTNEPFYIDSIGYHIPHSTIDSLIQSQPSLLKKGCCSTVPCLTRSASASPHNCDKLGIILSGKTLSPSMPILRPPHGL